MDSATDEVSDGGKLLAAVGGNLDAYVHDVGVALIGVILARAIVVHAVEGDDDVRHRLVVSIFIGAWNGGVEDAVVNELGEIVAGLECGVEYSVSLEAHRYSCVTC